jgi:signal transduction histidine kinase
MIPLIVRRLRIGLVILSYPAVYKWSESDLWPYQVTAAQLATAIDTRRQQLLLVQSSQQVAVLQERQRLARELHDSVTQLIFSMTLIAQSIAPVWARDPAEGQKRIDRLLELSQSALAEMRVLLFELRSPEERPPALSGARVPGITYLRHEGLVAALRQHIASGQLSDLMISLESEGYRPQPLEVEVAVFRITQEALNNVGKHARATEVAIRLSESEGGLCLAVADDGVGFVVENGSGHSPGGLGLHTMRERARALGGRLEIKSMPGQGTTVKVYLPRKGTES